MQCVQMMVFGDWICAAICANQRGPVRPLSSNPSIPTFALPTIGMGHSIYKLPYEECFMSVLARTCFLDNGV